jgi:N-acetylglucosamine malate deacetylase 1
VPPQYPSDILESEVRAGTKSLGVDPANLLVYKYRVRHLPHARQEILEELVRLRQDLRPDIVLMPSGTDLHQDHQTVYIEGLRAFKMVTVLGYELPWNNISFDARHFIVLDERHVQAKVDALHCYESQKERDYSQPDFIWGWARTRGVQIAATYAEAFDVLRSVDR